MKTKNYKCEWHPRASRLGTHTPRECWDWNKSELEQVSKPEFIRMAGRDVFVEKINVLSRALKELVDKDLV